MWKVPCENLLVGEQSNTYRILLQYDRKTFLVGRRFLAWNHVFFVPKPVIYPSPHSTRVHSTTVGEIEPNWRHYWVFTALSFHPNNMWKRDGGRWLAGSRAWRSAGSGRRSTSYGSGWWHPPPLVRQCNLELASFICMLHDHARQHQRISLTSTRACKFDQDSTRLAYFPHLYGVRTT